MRVIPDQLNSKNLVPFRKRHGRYKIPGVTSENEVSMDRVDTDLSPEEQSYVRHYLGYADALIRMTEESALTEPTPESASAETNTESASTEATTESISTPRILSVEDEQKEQPSTDRETANLMNDAGAAMDDRPAKAA
jgi:hypothetical protein